MKRILSPKPHKKTTALCVCVHAEITLKIEIEEKRTRAMSSQGSLCDE